MCGAIHRIVQGCFGDDDIVLSILDPELRLVTGGGSEWLVDRCLTDCHSKGGAVPRDETKGMAAEDRTAIPGVHVGGFE